MDATRPITIALSDVEVLREARTMGMDGAPDAVGGGC